MASRRKYELHIYWNHRRFGPQLHRTTAEGTSIRRAISNALLAFFSDDGQIIGPHTTPKQTRDIMRKNRRDAHRYLKLTVTRMAETAAPHTKADR